MNNIEVSIRLFHKLFDKRRTIVVPEYQRPYIWGKEKAEELLKDLEEYFITGTSSNPYYMGTVLYFFNKKEGHYEIIDGQQRITTLLIIQKILTEVQLPEFQDVVYNSHQSIKYIKEAQLFFQRNMDVLLRLQKIDFFNKLNFTLIITHSEDDAFTFFDTQNNRGIKLGATDFLKAYHLRAIKSEILQEQCARQWEKSSAKISEGSLLTHLFEKVLWRARNWKGQTKIEFENKDAILKTFQKSTVKSEQPNSYPLYPNFFNRQAIAQEFTTNGELFQIESNAKSAEKTDYPFSLRQPLYKGLNFFRYTDKYIAIYSLLFQSNDETDNAIFELRRFYNAVYTSDTSVYLRHFMQVCMISYYDVFGSDNIVDASYCFDYLIGSIRLKKQQIKKESARRCLIDLPNNILDIISNAYLPEEVFQFVYAIEEIDEVYEEESIKINDGVRGRYKSRIVSYFNKNEKSLKNRKSWGRI